MIDDDDEHNHIYKKLKLVRTLIRAGQGRWQDDAFLVRACWCGSKQAFLYGDYYDMVIRLDQMRQVEKAKA